MTEPVISFLRRSIRPGWDDSGAGFLTAPVFNHAASTFTGAAYRADGSLILQSLRPSAIGHWRPIDPVTLPPDAVADAPLMEEAIYGGHYINVWGHVLLETLSTATVASAMPDCPVVFSPLVPGADHSVFLAAWERCKPLLSAAGWGTRPLVMQDGPMRFRRLVVPERGAVFAAPNGQRILLPEMGDVYRAIRAAVAPDAHPERVVVARRPTWTIRKHPVEEEVYALLAAHGAVIVNGVDVLPIEQARISASASAIVGFAGSNLHNSVFAHDGVPVFEIGDERSYLAGRTDLRNPTQVAMCKVLCQPLTFVDSYRVDKEPLPAAEIVARIIG